MTAEEHVATAETHLRYAEGHLQPTEEHIADAEVHLKLVKAHLAALAAAEPPEVELCGTGTRPPVELAGGKADTGRRSAAPEGGRDPTPRPGTERGSGSDDGRPRPEAGEHLACPMRECRGLAIHPLDGCENFRSLSVTQREKVIKDWNRCECCLTDCRDKRTGSRCYRRIGFRRHHLLRLVPQAEASSAGDKKRQQQRPRRRVAKGDQTIPQGKPNQGDVRHDRGSAKALQPDVIIGWPDWSKVQPFVANGWAVSGQTPPGATAPATKWHLRMNQKGGPPMYLNVELDSMRQRSTITQEAAARMGRQYGASYMLSARAEDGEVRSLVAGGAITIIRADRRRPVERASKGPDLLLNAKDTNGMAKCLKPGWKSEEEIGGHGGCPVEGQWHGKLRGRQVLRDPGWTCVLFVKTGGASQDIFIRVMFDTIREQSVVLHSVAVKLGLRASGGPTWLTHPGEDPRYSSCVYEVPVLDWKGRRDWIKARGVSYVTPSEQRHMPEGAMEAFPKISLSGVTVSQAAGPVDMIIGRDNPEWMPVPLQEEPYERFTLMWTSLSPRCILRDNEGVDWRL